MPRLKPLWLHLGDLAGRLRCAGHLGIASDFDGTLTPIVPEPDGARLAPRSRDLLERLGIADGFIRVSCGIEHVAVVVECPVGACYSVKVDAQVCSKLAHRG